MGPSSEIAPPPPLPPPSGVAVQMTEGLCVAPALNSELVDAIFLQNVPSIIATHVLDPRPGDVVLDMCAAPGT